MKAADTLVSTTTLHDLELIDLISERHLQLRELITDEWHQNSDLYISNSEWYIIAKISEKERTTISYVTKNVDISRQATHKFIKNLEAKSLVTVSNMENNKKDKCLQLTPLGKSCYEMYVSIKTKIEQRIAGAIGSDQLQLLRRILQTDWNLT